MKCPRCQNDNAPSSRICARCGASLVVPPPLPPRVPSQPGAAPPAARPVVQPPAAAPKPAPLAASAQQPRLAPRPAPTQPQHAPLVPPPAPTHPQHAPLVPQPAPTHPQHAPLVPQPAPAQAQRIPVAPRPAPAQPQQPPAPAHEPAARPLEAPAPVEAPAPTEIHARPAPVWRRLGAWAVDAALLGGLSYLVFLAASHLTGLAGLHGSREAGVDWVVQTIELYRRALVPAAVFAAAAAFAYGTVFHALYGFTPGKLLFGLRVVTRTGRHPDWARSAVRSGVGLAGFALATLGPLLGLFTRSRRALHDLVAGTFVVRLA